MFVRLIEILDADGVPGFRSHRTGTRGQNGFEGLQCNHHAGALRTWQAVHPFGVVYVVLIKLDAREMSGRAARLLHPMRRNRSRRKGRSGVAPR